MFKKFLIAIGLKEPENIELEESNYSSVRPSSDNLFKDDASNNDIKIHAPSEEVEIKAIRTFNEMHDLGLVIKEEYIVCMDIRDVVDPNERRRIIDFVTGMAFISDYTMRSINKEGVFLILPPSKSLTNSEKERLQQLGLYRINV